VTGAYKQYIVAIYIVLLTLKGCATIATLTEPETRNKVFSGTVRHIEMQGAHATCFDMPFSLAADVVLLPVTIPWTAYNFIIMGENKTSAIQGDKEK